MDFLKTIAENSDIWAEELEERIVLLYEVEFYDFKFHPFSYVFSDIYRSHVEAIMHEDENLSDLPQELDHLYALHNYQFYPTHLIVKDYDEEDIVIDYKYFYCSLKEAKKLLKLECEELYESYQKRRDKRAKEEENDDYLKYLELKARFEDA